MIYKKVNESSYVHGGYDCAAWVGTGAARVLLEGGLSTSPKSTIVSVII